MREYATINRGTAQSHRTTVGQSCLIMSYVHLAHDCHVGDSVIISNGSQFAGHVTVEHHANISGLCVIHQFTRIGQFSFIGGGSRVPQNVPPFVMAVGSPIKLYGLNKVGLRAQRLLERDRPRAQACVPHPVHVGAQHVAGARAGGE